MAKMIDTGELVKTVALVVAAIAYGMCKIAWANQTTAELNDLLRTLEEQAKGKEEETE